MEFKVTKGLFGKSGLKLDGERILKNKYIHITTKYMNHSLPLAIAETNVKGQMNHLEVIDLTTKQPLQADEVRMDRTSVYSMKSYDDMDFNGKFLYTDVKSIAFYKDGETTLFVNGKEYSTKTNASRIELIYESADANTDIYLVVDKNGKYELTESAKNLSNDNLFAHTNAPKNSKIYVKNNPYKYLLVNPKQYETKFFRYDDIKNDSETYFNNLLEKASPKEKAQILSEKLRLMVEITVRYGKEENNIKKLIEQHQEKADKYARALAAFDDLPSYKDRTKFHQLQREIDYEKSDVERLTDVLKTIKSLTEEYGSLEPKKSAEVVKAKEKVKVKNNTQEF